jgi:hypothetical protein
MPKFRKKPVVIEAEQFVWQGSYSPGQMFMEFPLCGDEGDVHLVIPTLEGNHKATSGDWIITGVKGEKYPCKPDIFAMTYEPAP